MPAFEITRAQRSRFARIIARYLCHCGGPAQSDVWRTLSDDDIWHHFMIQIMVPGDADSGDRLKARPDLKRRIRFSVLRRTRPRDAKTAIWKVLRECRARWAGTFEANCRKSAHLTEILRFLKAYPGGPTGFVQDLAGIPEVDRVDFMLAHSEKPSDDTPFLSGIKSKSARDFLLNKVRLSTINIALDLRVLKLSHAIVSSVPQVAPPTEERYRQIEDFLVAEICIPNGITPAQFDQILFNAYNLGLKEELGLISPRERCTSSAKPGEVKAQSPQRALRCSQSQVG